VPELRIDLRVPASEIGDQLEQLLRHFEPFGIGNAAPTLALDHVRLASPPRKVGKDGVRLSIQLPTRAVDAIAWGLPTAHARLDLATPVDIAFRLERDDYRGANTLQLRVQSVRAAATAHTD